MPAVTAAVSRTFSRSRRSDSSTITTASAPGGIGAPVMMRMAWPLDSGVAGGGAPAGSSPTTVNSAGGDDRVGGDHGIAVDRAVGERRYVLGGGDVVGEDEADRICERRSQPGASGEQASITTRWASARLIMGSR